LDYDEETGMATPTVLYNENDPAHSLLNRAIERVPQWSIGEVSEYFSDGTNVNRADTMQRTFTVNGQTVYDFLDIFLSIAAYIVSPEYWAFPSQHLDCVLPWKLYTEK
jgi:hypothetical protein